MWWTMVTALQMTPSGSCTLAALIGVLSVLTATTDGQGFNGQGFNGFGNNANREFCRKGLCPYVKKLVPDLSSHPALDHYSPVVHGSEPPSLCGNMCNNDFQCPGHQKCCPTNCGYACFDAVFVADTAFHLVHEHNHEHETHYHDHDTHNSHETHHNTHS